METSVLKAFAGNARRQLLSEVRARLELVLAEGSTQRREFEPVIAKLESAIGDAGGGETGRAAVVDRVAYTWFNRIIALRFMDANSYTDISVVSPSVDRPDGQPEVLVDAKRGEFDADVVASADAQRITGLLNGSVTSSDPESAVFGLLLAAYCRFWNKSMPFMFEQSSDYTELLMPSDLLSDESVIARAVTVLTAETCADVEVIGWLYQFYIAERKDEVFAGFKKGKKAGAAEIPAATQLFTPDWIVRYLVENSLGRLWLLNRPDSTLVDRMDYYIAPVDEETDFLRIESPEEIKVMDPACGSGHMLTYAFDLLYAMYEEDGYNPVDIPSMILTKNLHGTEIDQRAGSLAAFALTMKARARQRTFFAKRVTPNICVLEPVKFTRDEVDHLMSPRGDRDAEESFFTMLTDADTLGALIRPDVSVLPAIGARVERLCAEENLFGQDLLHRARRAVEQARYLADRYHVIVANPPYMGGKNMEKGLVAKLKERYPETKADLFSAFVQRSSELSVRLGFVGIMSPNVWMYIASHEKLRKIITGFRIETLVELPLSGFKGATVQVCVYVFSVRPDEGRRGAYVRLVELRGDEEDFARYTREAIADPECSWFHRASTSDFRKVPGSPIAYWLPEVAFSAYAFGEKLGDVAPGQPGLQTSNNDQFVRYWHEVGLDRIGFGASNGDEAQKMAARWFPYLKGGDYRKWAGNELYVVDWEHNGSRIKEYVTQKYPYLNGNIDYVVKDRGNYFRRLISYTKITSGRFAARSSQRGFIFDVAGSAVFPLDLDHEVVLGFLCSTVGATFIKAQNPTLNVQSGDIDNLPFVREMVAPIANDVKIAVTRLVELSRHEWDSRETSWCFRIPGSISVGDDRVVTGLLSAYVAEAVECQVAVLAEMRVLENDVNRLFSAAYGFDEGQHSGVSQDDLGIQQPTVEDQVGQLFSYAVGCMFGRYSLDEPGLIIANQGDTLKEYLTRIPEPSFMPDEDNVIPVLADDWFDDDIVERFRLFLRVAFGEEHFEENLRFVEESLGKDIRRYFLTDFYKDHVQRYKKRPIYWMFSSPKGTFNALIYMHRYNPSTVSTVLNEYLREFQAKLEAELNNRGRIAADPSTPTRDKARAEKESDKLRKMIAELKDYEHDVLYPLASQQMSIDLDDGVKANYPKFGTALKKIPGLEAASD